MPRITRITFDSALLHIFNRGNARQIVFHDDEDFEHFLSIVAYFKDKYGLTIVDPFLLKKSTRFFLALAKLD
jgi:hypothetical protein